MAFLDNSGDIILDAVLTDAGRQRMARGNFKITKFAFGDEEINYGIFNGTHPSGSAFYDLEIMQTPILEAFTNNTSLMKSKLITMNRNNILFLPMLKINDNSSNNTATDIGTFTGGYIVLADANTEKNGTNERPISFAKGILRGSGDQNVGRDETTHIAIDQGIDSSENGLSFKQELPDDLVETAFLIKVDHRLLVLDRISAPGGAGVEGTVSIRNQFVDDDGVASYYVAQGDGNSMVEGKPRPGSISLIKDGRGPRSADNAVTSRSAIINHASPVSSASAIGEAFDGPLGSILRFYPRASMHLRNSSSLFNELGSSGTDTITLADGTTVAGAAYKFIDTIINVVGVTTGYSIDVPIRIVRKN